MAASKSGSHLAPSSKGSHSSKKTTAIRRSAPSHNKYDDAVNYPSENFRSRDRYPEYNENSGYEASSHSDGIERDFRRDNKSQQSPRYSKNEGRNYSYLAKNDQGRRKTQNRQEAGSGKNGFRNFIICFITFCVIAGVGAMGTLLLITHGPSEYAQKVFVRMLSTTGTLYKVPYLFYSEEEIERLTYLDMDERMTTRFAPESDAIVSEVTIQEVPEDKETIELIDISGKTWKGKMVIVRDPSLVMLAIPKDIKATNYAHFYNVDEYCDMYGGIASTSAGGYGLNNNIPFGYVISEGEVVAKGTKGYCYEAVGIDYEGKMFVDWFTLDEIMERNPRYAVCWGPVLIKDGVKKQRLGGGYTARCCIGQTADGTILLAVIEGRMVSSIGATADDIADLMEKYGAINAINLDSGRSCVLYYMGEQMTKISAGSGVMITDRTLPNAFVVLPEE